MFPTLKKSQTLQQSYMTDCGSNTQEVSQCGAVHMCAYMCLCVREMEGTEVSWKEEQPPQPRTAFFPPEVSF